MKKTLIALMALAGVAMGANGDLTKLYDFDGIRNTSTGAGTMTSNTWDYDRTVYDFQQGGRYVGISNETVTNILNGTDQNTCLTLAFWINSGYNNSQYQMLFGWGEGGKGLKFGLKDQDLCAVTKNVYEHYDSSSNIEKNQWNLVALTIKSTSITSTVDGETTTTPALTMVLRDVTDNLTYQYSDKTYNAPQSAGSTFSVLSADSNAATDTFKGLLSGVGIFTSTGNGTDVTNQAIATAMGAAPMLIVPEPATATLSLLALAGLAARRRRK